MASIGRLLVTLRRLRRDRDAQLERANAELAELAWEAREAGATWPAIAEAVGMTRQGLRKFLNRHQRIG